MDKLLKVVIGGAIGVVLLLIFIFNIIGIVKIEGNEVYVIQDWKQGIKSEILDTGTKFYPNFAWDIYRYDIGTQKITFDDSDSNREAEYSRIQVEVGENGGQSVWVALSVNYRVGWKDLNGSPVFDKDLIIKLHKDGIGKTYESVVLKRTIQDVVNEIARPKLALNIYSGQGFVDFKNEIEKSLSSHPVFVSRGIYIENTIIYKIYLDPKYEEEIAGKQIAQQQKLRKQEETKAAEEEARKVFALSQAKVEQARQGAEADKIIVVKGAEAQAELEVLKATAEKKKKILDAEGERDANLARSSGLIAVGEAEAKIITLKTNALYVGESGERRAKVEIATAKAGMMKELLNHISVLPEKTFAKIGEAGNVLISADGGESK